MVFGFYSDMHASSFNLTVTIRAVQVVYIVQSHHTEYWKGKAEWHTKAEWYHLISFQWLAESEILFALIS